MPIKKIVVIGPESTGKSTLSEVFKTAPSKHTGYARLLRG